MEQLIQIEHIQLQHVQTLFQEHRMKLELTEQAKRLLAEEGYDPVFGARRIKRVMQRRIQHPLALKLLQGQFPDDERIIVDMADRESVFRRATREAVAAGVG